MSSMYQGDVSPEVAFQWTEAGGGLRRGTQGRSGQQ